MAVFATLPPPADANTTTPEPSLSRNESARLRSSPAGAFGTSRATTRTPATSAS